LERSASILKSAICPVGSAEWLLKYLDNTQSAEPGILSESAAFNSDANGPNVSVAESAAL